MKGNVQVLSGGIELLTAKRVSAYVIEARCSIGMGESVSRTRTRGPDLIAQILFITCSCHMLHLDSGGAQGTTRAIE